MNTNEIIYIDADMIGDDCSFEQAQAVAEKLTAAGYPAMAFNTSGSTPRGYASAGDIPDEIWLKVIEEVFADDAPDGIKTVDALREWCDSYDGDMPELDPDDYENEEEMEAADDERRKQY
jgi:hypothetical protein